MSSDEVWLTLHLKDGSEAVLRARDILAFQTVHVISGIAPPMDIVSVAFMRGHDVLNFAVEESLEQIKEKLAVGHLFA